MALRPKTLEPKELSEYLTVDPPVAVRPIDLDRDRGVLRLPQSHSGKPYRRLLALLRVDGRPLGWVALPVSSDNDVDLTRLPESVETAPEQSPGEGDGAASPEVSNALLSIIVATCANHEMAIRCVKSIVSAVEKPFEVVVVENRPRGSTVAKAIENSFPADARIRYVEEPRPGLSWARNAGLDAARGEFIAFTDDDVRVDPGWASAVRRTFAAEPETDCVTGLILPSELETPAQLLDERFASFGKGFDRRTYSLNAPPPDQPLFPYTAGYFGSGANMAFRAEAIRDIGGFDRALGTGTPARGGEDLDICIRLLHSGRRLTYEPAAMVWHRHPDTFAGVRRHVFNYGVGLGAMLTKQIIVGPNRWSIISRSLQGLRYYTNPKSRKNAQRGQSFPRSLIRLERIGPLCGPVAYLASRIKARS
jgi:O-antigen biosynthesis protein